MDEAIDWHENWLKNNKSKYKINPNQCHSVEFPKNLSVEILDLEGKLVDTFPSQSACADWICVTRQAINRALVRGTTLAEKYKVKLANT